MKQRQVFKLTSVIVFVFFHTLGNCQCIIATLNIPPGKSFGLNSLPQSLPKVKQTTTDVTEESILIEFSAAFSESSIWKAGLIFLSFYRKVHIVLKVALFLCFVVQNTNGTVLDIGSMT